MALQAAHGHSRKSPVHGEDAGPDAPSYQTNLAAVADALRAQRKRTVTSYVIVLSFEPLDFLQHINDLIADFRRNDQRVEAVTGSPPRQVSETDFLVLTEQNDYGVVSLVTDLRTALLKLIRQYAPQAFGAIDQNELVRVYNLSRHGTEIRDLLQGYARERPVRRQRKEVRALDHRDVERVMHHIDALPLQRFVEEFVRWQPVTHIRHDRTPAAAYHEYYISMGYLQEQFLQGINVFLNMPLFKLLTMELDQRILQCILKRQIDPTHASFNFNLETLFSRRFEAVGESGVADKFIVELRPSDIFADFPKFQLAQQLADDLGVRMALDNVVPAMLAALRPEGLGCAYVKIQAQDELGNMSERFEADARALGDSGVFVVATRIETLDAVKAGMGAGINLFQGFYVDTLLNDDAERERFLLG